MGTERPRSNLQYRSLFWPVVLIGTGVIFLLNNLGILPTVNLWNLGRLWPLLLSIIGLDILFGRNSPQLGVLIGIGGVGLIIVDDLGSGSLTIR